MHVALWCHTHRCLASGGRWLCVRHLMHGWCGRAAFVSMRRATCMGRAALFLAALGFLMA